MGIKLIKRIETQSNQTILYSFYSNQVWHMIEDSEVSHTPSGKKLIDIVDNAKMVFNVNAYDDDLDQ